MQNVVITGAGMVGAQIIKILNKDYGIKPVVIDQVFQFDYLDTIIDREMYVQEECSILDEDRIGEILTRYKAEAIIHSAAVLPMRVGHDPHPGFYKVNTWGTTNLVFSAIASGVSTFVMFSTNGVYQFKDHNINTAIDEDFPSGMNRTNSYGNSKASVEYLLKELTALGRIDGKIIRPGEIFGPVMNRGNDDPIYWKAMIDAAILGQEYELKDHPEHRLDWVYCKDVANVAVNVVMNSSEHIAFHAASGEVNGIYDLKESLDKMFPGNKVKLVNCGKGGWNYPLSMDRVKADFGYAPIYDLEKGINDYRDWFLENITGG